MLKMNDKPDASGTALVREPGLLYLILKHYIKFLKIIKKGKFLAPLIFRVILAPVFLTFGFNKAMNFESTVHWFGNQEWGLGLPVPEFMSVMAIGAEIIGGFCLLFGFLTRIVSIPLIITMIVAIFTAHIDNGWHAIAPGNSQTNIARITQYTGFPGAAESLQNSDEVNERLQRIKSILKEHGDYDYLTEKGSVVILNNGIEFAFIYFAMLLSLLSSGAGMISLDFLLKWHIRQINPNGLKDL